MASNFASKQADLFAGLDAVTFKKDSSLIQDSNRGEVEERGDQSSGQRRHTVGFKSRESLFREQQDVGGWRRRDSDRGPSRSRDNSGFKRPKPPRSSDRKRKYTKYSLEDVSDITDRSNSRAAFDFLRQLREQREKTDEPAMSGDEKIVFKKPVKKREEDPRSGQTTSNSKKNREAKQKTLSHLNFEDEEEY